MADLLALSVRQPYAALLVWGRKPVENRRAWGGHRGRLVIHASATPTADWVTPPGSVAAALDGLSAVDVLTYGAAVGVVDVVDVCAASRREHEVVCECGPLALPGCLHVKIDNALPFDAPHEAAGQLGLWRIALPFELDAPRGDRECWSCGEWYGDPLPVIGGNPVCSRPACRIFVSVPEVRHG